MARRRGATDAAAVEDPFHRQSAKLPVGVFETDRTGDHTWVNERWSEMMGLSSDRAIGRGWLAAVHPDDRARTEAAWYAAIQAEREFVLEWRATASAERAIRVRAEAVPSRDTRGWSVGFVGTLIDVSGHERAEDLLCDSEGRLDGSIGSASDAVITVDSDQRVVLFNEAAERMFGFPTREVLGQRVGRFIPDGGSDADVGSGTAGRVLTARRADGTEFSMEVEVSEFTAGAERLRTFVVRDITQRERAEAERRELLRREHEARERAENAMVLVERVQAIADAALAGLSVDDLLHELLTRVRAVLGTDTAVILLREAEDVLRVRAALGLEEEVQKAVRVPVGKGFAGRIAAEGHPIVVGAVDHDRVVSRYLREKGIHSLAGIPLAVEGRVIGVLHVGSIRPRRFGDDEVRVLQLAGERIAVAIERATAHDAERAARAAAEAASRAKDAFLSTVSHELRTPLTAMLSWVRVIRQGKVSGEQVQRALETIERSGRTQAKLIDDLLDLGRIVSGRMRLEIRALELSAIVAGAVDAIRPMAEQKGVSVGLTACSVRVPISGDADRLQQVVFNLLSNAVKFTGRGGRIEVELTETGGRARLAIRDTGRGITAEFLPRVFEPFHQEERVRSRESTGLGLGLAIVRQLVELHGGSVTAESPGEGAGSTFTVDLPVGGGRAADAD